MGRQAAIKNNFTKGVLDPALADRIDLEQYYQGCLNAQNAIALPQGGMTSRGGLRKLYRLRRTLRRLNLTSSMVTAPNGGTAANLVDQNAATELRTASSVTGATFVVVSVDLGAPTFMQAVDAIQFSCSLSQADACFVCQISNDNATWEQLGSSVNVRTTARTRRFANAPGDQVQGRYIRLVVTGAPSIGTVGLMELRVWTETTKVSPVRKLPFTFDVNQTYLLVATDRNIDIFRAGVWKAAVPIPHRADQLSVVTRAQSRDTILLFHPEVPVRTVFRQGADTEWDSYAQSFSNVPAITGDTSFGQAQNEIQKVSVSGIADGQTLQVLIEEGVTAAVTKSSNPTTMTSAIQAAINALPNVGSGVVVSGLAVTATTLSFTITFAGAAGSRSWPQASVDVIGNDAATITVSTVQDGRPSSGSYMSTATGWPRCGAFYQSRLFLGGFKVRPETVISSAVADYFNFTQTSGGSLVAADVGVDFTLDSDEVCVIHHISVGRNLMLLTETAEWYITSRSIDATQPLNIAQGTRYGVRPGVEPLQVDGTGIFVQNAGNVVREMLWNTDEQDYRADSVTLLASHLVTDVVDLAHRRASTTSDGTQIYMVNRDGTLAVMTRIRGQQVQAMCPWATAGSFRAVGVDFARRVYAIVERTVGGQADNWLEQHDETAYLDSSVSFAFSPAQTFVFNLVHLEGKQVWAIGDGVAFGPFTVVGGFIELPRACAAVEVGLFFDFLLEPMPWRPGKDGVVSIAPHRITAVTLDLYRTSSVAVGANGGPQNVLSLQSFPAELDAKLIANPYSGERRHDRLYGQKSGTTCKVTRPLPGPITVRALYVEAV